MEFEWDPYKAAENVRKHGVSFSEASSVFSDELADTSPDPDHSTDEDRFITIGMSNRSRLLIVSHTDRRGRTRIISARQMTPREKEDYERER